MSENSLHSIYQFSRRSA